MMAGESAGNNLYLGSFIHVNRVGWRTEAREIVNRTAKPKTHTLSSGPNNRHYSLIDLPSSRYLRKSK